MKRSLSFKVSLEGGQGIKKLSGHSRTEIDCSNGRPLSKTVFKIFIGQETPVPHCAHR